MTRSDVVLLTVSGIGIFCVGVVWRPVFGDLAHLKFALESTSYVATAVAAIVAIYTLNAWKRQFRHAERFATLRVLKDAVTDLHLYRGHLLSVIAIYKYLRTHDGAPDPELVNREAEKREQLKTALTAYKKAWAAAVAFFTHEEEANFPGTPTMFLTLYVSRPEQIHKAHLLYIDSSQDDQFEAVVQLYDDEAKILFRDSVEEIESMLRRNI
ncbi:hypothetical protein [Pseudomonas sp. 18058]|uniref:hypothetical protein n=1 Tax=Pseudomonas sp. 18058 TaxID=2681406 RepID=UPI00135A3271|nr:hypothetical protein [Pseudomonas sp. 18058]